MVARRKRMKVFTTLKLLITKSWTLLIVWLDVRKKVFSSHTAMDLTVGFMTNCKKQHLNLCYLIGYHHCVSRWAQFCWTHYQRQNSKKKYSRL